MLRELKHKAAVIRNSVTVKSLMLMIVLSVAVLLCIQLVSYFYTGIYKKKAQENYQNSFEMYCAYWDNRLELVNNALIALTSTKNTEMPYWDVCNANGLNFETGKTLLSNRLSEIAWNHQNEVMTFAYVPERSVYVKSTNHLIGAVDRHLLDQDIQAFIENQNVYNSSQWDYFQSGGKGYFINIYFLYDGYLGAIVKCDSILGGLFDQGHEFVSAISLLNADGESLALNEGDRIAENSTDYIVPMKYLSYQFQISVLKDEMFGDNHSMIWLSIATIAFGLLLLVWNVRFQVRNVLGPLNGLKKAMERFSAGHLDTRLADNNTSDEINVLYRTFNDMTGEISNLKIEVYENQLEQERIQSNYLRVQIQPHFYTNILNLIYGLAQLEDYTTIQRLAMTTGAYFRYLLGEKGTLVVLKEEANGIRNYIKIQQMRYEGNLDFEMQYDEAMDQQMILPLVLQTFAENCVKHNITLVPVLKIQITISRQDGRLYLAIADNGVGFKPETLEKINQNADISKDGEHIGIRNVKERLRLFYGDQARVIITSTPGNTEITVIVPEVITEEEKHEYHIS